MGWAEKHIRALKKGITVKFRPQGNSMEPLVMSNDLVTVAPATVETLMAGDIVLCVVNGQHYLHKVLDVKPPMALIGNNKGRVNGWTDRVYGIFVRREP